MRRENANRRLEIGMTLGGQGADDVPALRGPVWVKSAVRRAGCLLPVYPR